MARTRKSIKEENHDQRKNLQARKPSATASLKTKGAESLMTASRVEVRQARGTAAVETELSMAQEEIQLQNTTRFQLILRDHWPKELTSGQAWSEMSMFNQLCLKSKGNCNDSTR